MGDLFGGGDVEQPQFERINISEVDQLARDTARRNAQDSIELEEEFRPELAALRNATFENLLSDLTGQDRNAIRALLAQEAEQQLAQPRERISLPELQRSALLQDAFREAQSDLDRGARLPRSVANEITRRAGQRGGRVNLRGSGATRDIVARDLGLNELDLFNQRLNRAAQFGQVEQGINTGQQTLADSINRFNVQSGIQQDQSRRAAGGFLSQLINNPLRFASETTSRTPLPQSGIDPGQVASLKVADINALNQFNQQQAAARAQQQSADNEMTGNLLSGVAGVAGTAFAGPVGGALAAGLTKAAVSSQQ